MVLMLSPLPPLLLEFIKLLSYKAAKSTDIVSSFFASLENNSGFSGIVGF